MDRFQPFMMERFMSKLEQTVVINLSKIVAHPLLLEEILVYDPIPGKYAYHKTFLL